MPTLYRVFFNNRAFPDAVFIDRKTANDYAIYCNEAFYLEMPAVIDTMDIAQLKDYEAAWTYAFFPSEEVKVTWPYIESNS